LLTGASILPKTQVFFECRHHLVCETYPNGIPDLHGEICKTHKAQPSIHRVIDSNQESRYGESKSVVEWNRLVETYSTCNLTKPKDKLRLAVAYLRGSNDEIYKISKMKDRDSRNYRVWRPPATHTIKLDFPLEERHNHADSKWQAPVILIRYFQPLDPGRRNYSLSGSGRSGSQGVARRDVYANWNNILT
jgi:hypothetical protein